MHRTLRIPAAFALLLLALAACGGGGPTAETPPASAATSRPLRAAAPAGLTPDPGVLLLLIADDTSTSDPRVQAWIDAAAEIGTRIQPIADAQLLAMGSPDLQKFAGLVLPDGMHTIASNEVIDAVHAYTRDGGRTLLVYDFGTRTYDRLGDPHYPVGGSPFADLAGVSYALVQQLNERAVGLGPVLAMTSTMRELLVPPGKSMPHRVGSTSTLQAARLASGEALFAQPTPADPGGVTAFDTSQFQNVTPQTLKPTDYGRARKSRLVKGTTTVAPAPTVSGTTAMRAMAPSPSAAEQMEAYTGYLVGELTYPTFVTSGDYQGKTIATSPQFGLVAGLLPAGAGTTLFVNMPLTYLKGRTDALPMHGFLHYFVKQVVHGARLSAMPNGVAGLTFDWHLDSNAAQEPSLALERVGVFFYHGKFNVEMTAGPDTILPGDKLGWNLPQNPVAQDLLRRLAAGGHAIGSHGGWIHDYYGDNADETNAADYLPYLVLNRDAVDGVVGRPARSYSAPQGNNPMWAMDWLEQQGVVGAYFAGHTGLGATRHYREGALRNPSLWVFPVTPSGIYATYEEWQAYGVPKADVVAWYRQLVDFSIEMNTSRLIYAHPPGANAWRDVLQELFAYAESKPGRFVWYTMPRLADFMTTRNRVAWTQTPGADGVVRVRATHPVSLAEMVWLIPKERYLKPEFLGPTASKVADGGDVWLVRAAAVPSLEFDLAPNPAFGS